jgi:hypothetical protein
MLYRDLLVSPLFATALEDWIPQSSRLRPAQMGRFLPVDVGLRLIILIAGLASVVRSRVACVAVQAALPGNMVVGEPA